MKYFCIIMHDISVDIWTKIIGPNCHNMWGPTGSKLTINLNKTFGIKYAYILTLPNRTTHCHCLSQPNSKTLPYLFVKEGPQKLRFHFLYSWLLHQKQGLSSIYSQNMFHSIIYFIHFLISNNKVTFTVGSFFMNDFVIIFMKDVIYIVTL
jgi:hypothetical protein